MVKEMSNKRAENRLSRRELEKFLNTKGINLKDVLYNLHVEGGLNTQDVRTKINELVKNLGLNKTLKSGSVVWRWLKNDGILQKFDASSHMTERNLKKWAEDEKYAEKMRRVQFENSQRVDVRQNTSNRLKEQWKDEEYAEKMSNVSLNNWADPEIKERMITGMKLANETEEVKQKRSNASKVRWENPEYHYNMVQHTKRQWRENEAYREIMRLSSIEVGNRSENIKRLLELNRKPTSIEIKVAKYLKLNNIDFKEQKRFYDFTNKRFVKPDFYLEEYNLVIECNGGYYHSDPRKYPKINELNSTQLSNRNNDIRKFVFYAKRRYNVLVLWEHEITSNFEYCVSQLKRYINLC